MAEVTRGSRFLPQLHYLLSQQLKLRDGAVRRPSRGKNLGEPALLFQLPFPVRPISGIA